VVLGPGWSHTVVVRGRAIDTVDTASGDDADPGRAIARIGRIADDAISVTVDIAPLLLGAVRTRQNVAPVAVIRVAPRPASDPAFARSPAALVEQLVTTRHFVPGGHDLLGNELRELDRAALDAVCTRLAASGAHDVAIVSPGSGACPAHEREVADAIQSAVPGARIAAASDYGGQGLASREATVILDCALSGYVDKLLDLCERALARLPRRPALQVARSDGGCSTASHIRALPLLALAATEALELSGAAHLADAPNCRVLLRGPTETLSGEVRHGTPVVQPAEYADLGTELVIPVAALVPVQSAVAGAGRVSDQPVVASTEDFLTLAGVGAAVSRPSAWLDVVAVISSADGLNKVRQELIERATGIVMATGAAVPGSACLVDVSAVALPYSSSGTVRIRVRVTGEVDRGAAGGRERQ
jgi:hypothetical protein